MLYKNLNDLTPIPSGTSELFFAYIGFLANTWKRVPCYLVDSDLMTEIYGFRRIPTWNEECAKKVAEHIPDDLRNIDDFWSQLDKCEDEDPVRMRFHVALGIYVQQLDDIPRNHIRDLAHQGVPFKPLIFLCPERIAFVSVKLQEYFPNLAREEIFRIIFVNVYFHELTHAFIDRRRGLSQLWERVIDESLATAVAHSLFPKQHEQAVLRLSASRLPVQYRGYDAWLTDTRMSNPPRLWSNSWRHFCNNGTLPQDLAPPRFMRTSFRSILPLSFHSHRRSSGTILQQPNVPTLFWKSLAAVLFRQALGLE